jgi:hypothetical protein
MLETTLPPAVASIPALGGQDRPVKPLGRRAFLTRSAAVLGAAGLGAVAATQDTDASGHTAPAPTLAQGDAAGGRAVLSGNPG